MKTTAYNNILFAAAELAQRTRDKLPVAEAVQLRGYLAADLRAVWNKAAWPELVLPIEEVPVTDREIDKREGEANEMGDVLGVYTANPQQTTRARAIGFDEGDGCIRLDESRAVAYVEYMLPAPDLLAIATEDLGTYPLPQRFANYLALRAAGWLLKSDGQDGSGETMLAVAESALAAEEQRIGPPPPWRSVRLRRGYGKTPVTNNQ